MDTRAKFEVGRQAGSRRSRELAASQVGRRSTEWRAHLPGPPESVFSAGAGAAILDGGSAECESDDARAARGPVPWAGDAPNVTASRSLTRRGEEERTRRHSRTTGHRGGRAPSGPAKAALTERPRGCRAEGPGQAAVTPGGAGRAGALGPGVMAGEPSSRIPTQDSAGT
ncbi:hypothetical protein J1605_005396 [Eschrichtius robustus]|uniref:Uncharacterized protein n=1 Tax=Eschrichtius robustus TaxID=9764 RepID=A0AB34H9I8_ESCRO|nr:hypothetical protein J1605_005396 [Eschrichtius robustus]